MLRHTRKHALTNGKEGTWIDRHTEIVMTADGDYMILKNGFQIGGHIDRSGAGDKTFGTLQAARMFYQDWNRTVRHV